MRLKVGDCFRIDNDWKIKDIEKRSVDVVIKAFDGKMPWIRIERKSFEVYLKNQKRRRNYFERKMREKFLKELKEQR